MNAISPAAFDTEAERREAVRRRDPRADGRFVLAVLTTGIYCRPVCTARPPRPENVRFYADGAEAERAGYRACKRCRPDQPPRAEREAALVAQACRTIEEAETEPTLGALAGAAGLSPHYFHRLFRRITGVTPKAYAASERARRVQASLGEGESVTGAIYRAGFNSSGRFYEAAGNMLGMRPSSYRAGGAGEAIRWAVGESTIGLVMVAATARGICSISLGDDAAELLEAVRARFPRAVLVEAEPAFAATVQRVVDLVDGRPSAHDLPLDIRGTAFQRRVWEELQAIPRGETVSYGELAARIGQKDAVRSVASACAANPVAVAVPCHRVVGRDGKLTGYRWGVERKHALLRREAAGER